MFKWDEAKRRANIAKHGIDFVEVERFELDTAITIADRRYDYGEIRYISTGFIENRSHVLTYTMRSGTIRVIGLRKANARERKKYARS